ncbi:MAG: AgmX/PglI C-terminal domain-containing protein [Myxococcota bacterium]
MTQSVFAYPSGAFDFSPTPAPLALSGEHYEFALLKSGPDVNPEEVELTHVTAVEVMVLWGSNVLHVSHLTPPRDFLVGESGDAASACDVLVPPEKIGQSRFSLVRVEHGEISVVKPSGATGFVESANGRRALASQGVEHIPLADKTRVEFELGGFIFKVASVNAGRPVKKGLGVGWDWNVAAFFGLSLFSHASLLAAVAFFVPSMSGISDEDSDRERLYVMQQYLDASAERERERETELSETGDKQEGGTGQQAAGEQGAMGKPTAAPASKRYEVKGPKDNPDPHLAREAARREAAEFGMIGLLNSMTGDPNAPTAPWGLDTSLGTGEISANGNMWGDEIGDAFGTGLGLAGLGEGGGGRGRGIGAGDIGTIGRGAGLGDGSGWGNGHGQLGRGHVAKSPGTMRPLSTTVSGRLPPEVVQRIVRQNFGRFRACYQTGLSRNPNLEGRVAARFVISRDGSVSNVANGGSDLPDASVVSCVLSAFYGLSFPQPENGIVTVTYPMMLSPG